MTLTFSPSEAERSLGHHIILGLSGSVLSDNDKRMLNTIQPLGVILFDRNFEKEKPYSDWLEDLRNLLAAIPEYIERKTFVCSIDHEGGRVVRTPEPLSCFPYAQYYSEVADRVGDIVGVELSSLGINVNWAPVVDIHSNPDNPVIGERAFGSDPKTVTAAATKFLDAMQAHKVLGCVKHFPGHGDTATDSHVELPVLDHSLERMQDCELIPFKNLVSHGVPAVMTAHVLFRTLDPDYPATLSERVLTGLLREELGFGGLVVSDDLEMGAVRALFNREDTPQTYLRAGGDVFLCSRNPDVTSEQALHIIQSLKKALKKKQLTEHQLELTFNRINDFYNTLSMNSVRELSESTRAQHAAFCEEVTPA